MIHANTDAARHEVLDFFLAAFDDIDPNAVPTTVTMTCTPARGAIPR